MIKRPSGATRAGASSAAFIRRLKKECLRLLLRGKQPIIICPARSLDGMRIPREWREPIEQGRLLLLSCFAKQYRRATADQHLMLNSDMTSSAAATLSSSVFVRRGCLMWRAFVTVSPDSLVWATEEFSVMTMTPSRRSFLGVGAAAVGAAVFGGGVMGQEKKREYGISLAGWSLHRTIGTAEDKIPMLEMPKISREEFDIEAIELVSTMLASTDHAYLDELGKNAAAHDVAILLIMVDNEGSIGAETPEQRDDAVTRHQKWVDIANGFGCHSIRMNWSGAPRDVVQDEAALAAFIERSVPAFRKLCDYGDSKNINVIIENHGGASSYPEPMKHLMAAVDHPRFGTLPDFGNFPAEVDKYSAIDVLMNYAKAVSAKCYDFDDVTGDETTLDYERLISIVHDKHGYTGYIGIEYEGRRLSEYEGIRACKRLLERLKR
jgi:L-ribulose-5-phosphate 3-epimerase